MEQKIRIVFAKGDRTKLSFGILFDYEERDWCIASRRSFPDTEEGKLEAVAYARELAKKNNLSLDCSVLDIQNENYLD